VSERIVILGPGRMGLTLGAALVHAGAVDRLVYFGRDVEPPPHPIFDRGLVEYAYGLRPVPGDTTIVILAVPDDRLGDVAHDLSGIGRAPDGCVALHLAGAISGSVLEPLHAVGYEVGSLHPLQAIADPWSAADRLVGSAFAVAGEPAAMAAARRLVFALDGRPLVIPATMRPLYHAAAVMASNYVVALASTAARLLQEAGVPEADALPSILPLMRGSLDNVEHLGAAAALTGPIVRGDAATVRMHLMRLSDEDRSLYCALAGETLSLARAAGLDEARAAELSALLSTD